MSSLSNTAVIILAAGKGTRMKSDLPKVLTKLHGKPLIEYVLEASLNLDLEQIVIVVGHKGELVRERAQKWSSSKSLKLEFATQEEQLGTGHATRCGVEKIDQFVGNIVILPGDVPLLKAQTLEALIKSHVQQNATLSVVSFEPENPTGYGRIVRNKSGLEKIVEEKDCSSSEREINEVNSGIMCVDSAFLLPALKELSTANSQGEYYLTDIIERAVKEGQTTIAVKIDDADQFAGINTKVQLAILSGVLMERRIEQLIESGVNITDPRTVYVDESVEISPGVEIGPNTQILGNSKIGKQTKIEGSAYIIDSEIGEECTIKFGVRMQESKVGKDCMVGPFAHLRPGAVLENENKIGNFVEVKKSILKKGAQASHLTYIGDAEVGQNVNFGAGTITANYDGVNKHKTIIGDGSSTGSNSVLVAPVTLGKNVYVGAGSVVTKDVQDNALAITRAPQKVIPDWSKKQK